MASIVLLSDTHSYIDKRWEKHLKDADEIWHAGDIGNPDVLDYLSSFAKLRVVWGNIDSHDLRAEFPEDQIFELEGFKVWMRHIGGYPNRYPAHIKKLLSEIKPDIFICGHSHILKVIYDKKYQLIHMNPGGAGKYGAQTKQTILRFDLIKGEIKNMQVVEWDK